MTAIEMLVAFETEMASVHKIKDKVFKTADVEHFLNKAQDRFIKQRYDITAQPESANLTEKRADDIRELVKYDVIAVSGVNPTTITNSKAFDLPADYFLYLSSKSTVDRVSPVSGTTLYANKRMNQQHIDNYIENTDNQPYFRNPIVFFAEGEKLIVVHDSYCDPTTPIPSIELTYVKEPAPISINAAVPVDCELADSTHREIVDIAVNMALENIKDPRYQTNIVEEKEME